MLQLVAHPVRWSLLQELAGSDRSVAELTELVDVPQSLVSYHLRRLRDGELVSMRRSSADRRDSYYRIELERCGSLLEHAGAALHPGLRVAPVSAGSGRGGTRRRRRPRVLFLCTGNSARSQMAEALVHAQSGGAVESASAGSHPKPLHPNAVRVMQRRDIDISANRSKHVDELVGEPFDVVITLCDRVREVCPEFSAHPRLVHWSVADPALEGPNDRATLPAFEHTASELEIRIRFLLASIDEHR